MVRARGRLERRDGAVNIIVADLGPLEYRPVEGTPGAAVPSDEVSFTVFAPGN